MRIFSLLLLIGLIGTSCSMFNKKKTTEKESDPMADELVEDNSFQEEDDDVVASNIFDDTEGGPLEEQADAPVEENLTEGQPVADSGLVAEIAPEEPVVSVSADMGSYKVLKNETLMIVAFKIYGDYSKWRELAELNKGKLVNGHQVMAGVELSFNAPAEKFEWRPEGNPYLIKRGDTLGTISKDTYGTPRYWKNIWHNNEPLIKDPNVIFAGFTIYTPTIEGRDVAFKK